MTEPSDNNGRRSAARGPDRRREGWGGFREAYPTFLRIISVVFLLLMAGDMWLFYRRHAYSVETASLRAKMTDAERKKSDFAVQSENDKVQLALQLAKRQAHFDPRLHLSIAVDSGVMYLERDGALLRVMRVALAPAKVPGFKTTSGDTSAMTLPRGQRTIQQVIDGASPALVLNGDARIYSGSDTDPVAAGDVRVDPADLKAILPNVGAGMTVYFY
ncbi:MAG: hypothetical protein M3Z30_03400 [Gemmatimonadota bacterium]|nr:hypothetical protein [Gemmatimonadota bacterium]